MDDLLALLNTPVISATGTKQRGNRAPATMMVVSAETIQRRQYRSLADLLKDLPDFKIDNAVHAETFNTITVRGVPGQTKFLILLDGIRIGAATNEPLPVLANFPVHIAKQVEVLYGPASALYGADAFTGVINIIPFKGSEAEAQRSASLEGGDHGLRDLHGFWSGSVGRNSNLCVGFQTYQDDRVDPESRFPQDYAGMAESLRTGVFKTLFGSRTIPFAFEPEWQQPIKANNVFLRYDLDRLTFTVFHNYARVPSSVMYTPNNMLPNASAYVGTKTWMGSVGYKTEVAEGWNLDLSLTGRQYEVDPHSNFVNVNNPNMVRGYKYAFGQSLRFDQQLHWQAAASTLVSGGLSFEAQSAVPWGTNMARPANVDTAISGEILGLPEGRNAADIFNIKMQNYGGFLQAQHSFGPDWHLTLGTRYDKNSRYGGSTNPRLGLVWTPTEKVTFKGLYGRAFLAPSPYSAYRHFGSFFTTDGGQTYRSNFWHLPNPGLKPQKAETAELSARVMLTPNLSLSANVYRSVYDQLQLDLPDQGSTNLYRGMYKGWPVAFIRVTGNAGKQTSRGGNLQIDFRKAFPLGMLEVNAGWSHVDGTVDLNQTSTEIGQMAPDLRHLNIEFSSTHWSVSARALQVGTQRSPAKEPTTPDRRIAITGYKDLALTLSYHWPRLTGFLRVENALDQDFRNIGEESFVEARSFKGTPQEPRRASLGLQVRF